MYNAAQLAVEQANEAGGFEGVPFRIVSRWDSDPWRGGSKQMIKLVYEDDVWAVIGSVDGASTHVAEQVVTKAWLPLISPVSADPTLTYIRIPWMFRLPPDDPTQAQAIVRDGLLDMSLAKVGVITGTDHDGRVFAEDLLDAMHAEAIAPMLHFEVSPTNSDAADIASRVRSFAPEALVIRLPREPTLVLLDRLRQQQVSAVMLLPWIPGLQLAELERRTHGNVKYVLPFSSAADPAYLQFAEAYRAQYGTDPTPSAAYTYDAVNLIVRSLAQSGLNRPSLRDAIAAAGFQGVTGRISWDNAGGNVAQPVLIRSR
jgi:ABC-type branched-subunit amino acid transport system substrate-binding protein